MIFETESSNSSSGKSVAPWIIVLAASIILLLLDWWQGMHKTNVHGSRYLFPLGGIVLAAAYLFDRNREGLYKIGTFVAAGLWLASIFLTLAGK